MDYLLGDDELIDLFLDNDRKGTVGQNLLFEVDPSNLVSFLKERATGGVIARLDRGKLPFKLAVKRNLIGYETLGESFVGKGFSLVKSGQPGVSEYRLFKLKDYSISQSSVADLWKAWRASLVLRGDKEPFMLLHEDRWQKIKAIKNDGSSYLITFRDKFQDLIVVNLPVMWGEPTFKVKATSSSPSDFLSRSSSYVRDTTNSSSIDKPSPITLTISKRLEVVEHSLADIAQYIGALDSYFETQRIAAESLSESISGRLILLENRLDLIVSLIGDSERNRNELNSTLSDDFDLERGLAELIEPGSSFFNLTDQTQDSFGRFDFSGSTQTESTRLLMSFEDTI
jgi:hypothetical protein